MAHYQSNTLPTLPSLSSTSPLSSAASHSSTRLYSLHRKLRNNSSNPSESTTSSELRDVAAKSAKRHLREIIREDWTYDPSAPPLPLSSPPSPLQYTQEWRCREPDSSSSAGECDIGEDSPMNGCPPSNPYKFDNPDSIRVSLDDRQRKRRKLLQEEMSWNPGLRIWVERRDAWSGARRQRRIQPQPNGGQENHEQDHHDRRRVSDSDFSSPTTSSSCTSLSPSSTADSRTESTLPSHGSDSESLIPLAPSILPSTNPIRASITPSIYPSIYSKVIIQSLTPTVPMNLSDVTRALVQGWKDEGQWPPKPSVITEAKRDVLMFRKREKVNNGDGNGGPGKVRKGVGAVRKALGLSGSVSSGNSGPGRESLEGGGWGG